MTEYITLILLILILIVSLSVMHKQLKELQEHLNNDWKDELKDYNE